MQRFLLILACLIGLETGNIATAQTPKVTTHATLLGIGYVGQLDTYLSPLNYSGLQAHVVYETLRPLRTFKGHVTTQGWWQANVCMTEDASRSGKNLGGNLVYERAWHYNWHPVTNLTLMAGPQVGANLGMIYSTRNGNNPAQALASLHLSASLAAVYRFRLFGLSFAIRDQLDAPLIGAMFSPEYGQSYYEIFEKGDFGHNICVTTPVNAPTLRNLFTLDFPIGNCILRAGYLMDIRQSHVNHIKHHSYTHAFMLGWVKHFTVHKRREAAAMDFVL